MADRPGNGTLAEDIQVNGKSYLIRKYISHQKKQANSNTYAETKHMFLTERYPCDNFGYRNDNSINNGEDRWKKLFGLNSMEKLYD